MSAMIIILVVIRIGRISIIEEAAMAIVAGTNARATITTLPLSVGDFFVVVIIVVGIVVGWWRRRWRRCGWGWVRGWRR